MSLPDDVLELRPEIIALRRELHQHPELAAAVTAASRSGPPTRW